MQCLILAGGLGTRMKPFTQRMPKALIEVRGRPFLHYQLEALVDEGVSDVVLSIGYKGEMIREAAGDGSSFGVTIRYVDEGSNLLGTGGALRKAYPDAAPSECRRVAYGLVCLVESNELMRELALPGRRASDALECGRLLVASLGRAG